MKFCKKKKKSHQSVNPPHFGVSRIFHSVPPADQNPFFHSHVMALLDSALLVLALLLTDDARVLTQTTVKWRRNTLQFL